MAKKKKPTPAEKLGMDLTKITVPFDLFTPLSVVIEEMRDRKFIYSHYTQETANPVLWFENEGETISINIEKDNLLIRQFSKETDTIPRKLKVIYVVKPAERKFKLV